jgi:hypothetical protein
VQAYRQRCLQVLFHRRRASGSSKASVRVCGTHRRRHVIDTVTSHARAACAAGAGVQAYHQRCLQVLFHRRRASGLSMTVSVRDGSTVHRCVPATSRLHRQRAGVQISPRRRELQRAAGTARSRYTRCTVRVAI